MTKGLNLESQLEAEKLLEQAIQMDPSFARAHVVLADTYFWRATLESDTNALTQQMLHEAQVAVDLDPMDGDAHQALGFALNMRGEFKQAEIQFDEALRLNPNSFDVLAGGLVPPTPSAGRRPGPKPSTEPCSSTQTIRPGPSSASGWACLWWADMRTFCEIRRGSQKISGTRTATS